MSVLGMQCTKIFFNNGSTNLVCPIYHKYVSNNALVYVSLLILTHIAYYRFVLYDYYYYVPFISRNETCLYKVYIDRVRLNHQT